MERERWETLYRKLKEWDHCWLRGRYSATMIVAVYFWAVLHDRPVCWACQAKNWPSGLPLRRWLPSQSTMSRRLRQLEVRLLLTRIDQWLREKFSDTSPYVKVVDAKPLPVGGHSGDPDTRWGYGIRGFLKGYKLFAIWGNGPLPLCWRVGPMNLSEARVAEQLVPQLPGSGFLLADKVYDVNRLYDAAHAARHQLLAQRKRPTASLGHRRHSPWRLRAIALLKTQAGKHLYELRTAIERQFGRLTNFGGGLAPLPNWVRRRHRVQLWVHAKLIINALRLNDLPATPALA